MKQHIPMLDKYASKGVKVVRLRVTNGKKLIVAINEDQGNIITDKEKIVEMCRILQETRL